MRKTAKKAAALLCAAMMVTGLAAAPAMAGEGGFEQLLREVFLENRHHARVIMLPSKTIAGEKREAEKPQRSAGKSGKA